MGWLVNVSSYHLGDYSGYASTRQVACGTEITLHDIINLYNIPLESSTYLSFLLTFSFCIFSLSVG